MYNFLFLLLFFAVVPSQANIVSQCGPQNSDRNCLICNCFRETRGEPMDEKIEVTRVVRRRIIRSDFPNSACAVVHDRTPGGHCEFSWCRNHQGIPNIATARECVRAVDQVMAERITETNPSFFNVCGIGSWAENSSNCRRIAGHTSGSHCWFSCSGGTAQRQYMAPMNGSGGNQ